MLELTRLDARRYETRITRADGVTYHVKGVGHMGTIPHDLAHYVVEQGLGIEQGFWGSVAAGAVFDSLTHVEGRRRPQAARRSDEVLRSNKPVLTETEILVGLFDKAMADGLTAESAELRRRVDRYTWTPPGHTPRSISDADVAKVVAGWTTMLGDWQSLPVGETMTLQWPERKPR